ncbi:hypothetical protein [Sediminibacillus halophilus]|uniref:Sporulation protein YpjB n=1 Tax=Sediminibacillus halophilus TaxID=482461 RepID=A0A1G9QQU5_9BACI|nr:hypothetical protein [Sediminibacillus halophilus]SDM13230.1 hypothetical protein SAMN05216244_1616 [Sediminibacillus halophilus]
MMEFLYFPEDKTEYIPALISLVIFSIGAAVTMYLIYKHSKKEERRIDEKYSINSSSPASNEKQHSKQ